MPVWLPSQQAHAIGRAAAPVGRDPSWRVRTADGAGVAASISTDIVHPSRCRVQLHATGAIGAEVAVLRTRRHGDVVQETIIRAEKHDGWQRIDIDVPQGPVDLELLSRGTANLHIGAWCISPAEPRPIWNIGHRTSTVAKFERFLAEGANAIECDVTPVHAKGRVKMTVFHGGDVAWTRHEAFADYLGLARQHLEAGDISFLLFDTKRGKGIDPRDAAEALCRAIIDAGLPAERCGVSVPTSMCPAYFETLEACDLDLVRDTYEDWPDTPEEWLRRVDELGTDVQGVGSAAIDPTPFGRWLPWLGALVNHRDRGAGELRKAYYWTVDRRTTMRKVLDLGADAIIVNHPDRLRDVLAESMQQGWVRPATAQDSLRSVIGSVEG